MLRGPYFPPDYPDTVPDPVYPAQPGALLLLAVLAVLVILIIREQLAERRRGQPEPSWVVEELDIRWLPAEAFAAAQHEQDQYGQLHEVLEFGRQPRSRRPSRQREPT